MLCKLAASDSTKNLIFVCNRCLEFELLYKDGLEIVNIVEIVNRIGRLGAH